MYPWENVFYIYVFLFTQEYKIGTDTSCVVNLQQAGMMFIKEILEVVLCQKTGNKYQAM